MSMLILSFSTELEYKNVMNGNLKMLIPADFIKVPKGSYKTHYSVSHRPRSSIAIKTLQNIWL